jgi:hypothetical protein
MRCSAGGSTGSQANRDGSGPLLQANGACAVLTNCSPAAFPGIAGLPANAGGTGWDAGRSAAWISNGQFLACVDPGGSCGYLCAPIPVPGMPGNLYIVGLEVVNSLDQIWALDSAANGAKTTGARQVAGQPPVVGS